MVFKSFFSSGPGFEFDIEYLDDSSNDTIFINTNGLIFERGIFAKNLISPQTETIIKTTLKHQIIRSHIDYRSRRMVSFFPMIER